MNDSSGAGILVNLLDRSQVEKMDGMSPEQKSELIVNAVKCLGTLKFEGARDKIRELSQSDPDLSVRDASIEALKKL
jgi:HEAT repeat protein